MELKRLLDRANALLLQGAYRGAESFIEQAIAEADKLKSELAELDTLRTRVTEIAAEVERLQSVIDAANVQEPIYQVYLNIEFRWTDCSKEQYERSLEDQSAAVRKLYTNPIPAQQLPVILNGVYENKCSCGSFFFGVKNQPFCAKCYDEKLKAQQSPAVAVHEPSELDVYRWFQESTVVHHIEEDGAHISKRAMFLAKKAIEFAQQSPCITEQDSELSLHRADYNAIKSDGFESPGELLAAHKYLLANRITEQDAREIIDAYIENKIGVPVSEWLHPLLNKLNGDQNGK